MPVKQLKEENEIIIVNENDQYAKSNSLIGAKYKSNLVENKIMSLSLSKADEMISEEVEINGETTRVFTSIIRSHEIEKFLCIDQKNRSSQLTEAYINMSSRQIGIVDERGNFRYRTLFIGSDYCDGDFKLYYNPLLGNFYKNVSKNFTQLSLATMMNFRSNYSFRLYEILKKDCYVDKDDANRINNSKVKYIIEYKLAELRFLLGTVNTDNENVRRFLDKRDGAPDYERAFNATEEKVLVTWADFKKWAINVAVEEINEKTEMYITYKPRKSGRGGKVDAITFDITIDYAEESCKIGSAEEIVHSSLTEDEKFDFIESLTKTDLSIFSLKELKSIAETSNYSMEKINKAIEVAKTQKTYGVGFIIDAIKNDWEKGSKVVNKTENEIKKNFSKGMETRNIDVDALEELLLNKENMSEDEINNKFKNIYED